MPIVEVIKLLGSIAFFIFGMHLMSDGVNRLASGNFKAVINAMSGNRFTGILTGFFSTSIVQSSSTITVLIVSFVNAKLISLKQSIYLVLGSNIGTTLTAWLILFLGFGDVSFSNPDYILPLLVIAVPIYFSRNNQLRSFGTLTIGFVILVFGLAELKSTVIGFDLSNNIYFTELVENNNQEGIKGVFSFFLLGLVFTSLIQSSSAALALTLAMVVDGLSFELAAGMILGANLGTTITCNLAAIVANTEAKKAARAHFVINLMGILWAFPLFYVLLSLVGNLFDYLLPIIGLQGTQEIIQYELALFHTGFNLINVVLVVWFVPFIEKMASRLVFAAEVNEQSRKDNLLNPIFTSSSDYSMLKVHDEVHGFLDLNLEMMELFGTLINQKDQDKQQDVINKIIDLEEKSDSLELKIASVLTRIAQNGDGNDNQIRKQLIIVTELERIADKIYDLSELFQQKRENKIWFIQKQRDALLLLLQDCILILHTLKKILKNKENAIELSNFSMLCERLNQDMKNIKRNHYASIQKGNYKIKSGVIFNNMFTTLASIEENTGIIFSEIIE
ncbi:MAG: hypothetical protein CNE98_02805 [Bacteroidetes bacterium MED-G17]|nr:MAG: hypothetical protein CNE98_02805 [Bacteroidetes bacterium MED-G17]